MRSRSNDYERGQWKAYDDILHWLNTLETLTLRKTDIYAKVASMRPVQDWKLNFDERPD